MPEVSQRDLETLQQSHTLLQKLYEGKNRHKLEALVKDEIPEARTSADLAEPILAPLQEKLKELEAFKDGITQMQADYGKSQAIGRLKKAGYTDEGVQSIEKLMEERGIGDYEAGAALFDRLNPAKPVQNVGLQGSYGNALSRHTQNDDADAALLRENPQAFKQKKINEVFDEYRRAASGDE